MQNMHTFVSMFSST